jgi:hypothetical protein
MHQIISWGQSSCRIKSKTTIAFYSRKLNTAQNRYTTNERDRELLSAIETCKEYKNILLGDHKNNTFNGLKIKTLQSVFVLAFTPLSTFEYLPGKKNVTAVVDVLSRLDIDSLKIQEETEEASKFL